MSMVKVGAKYGVSDNGVRKWLRWYQNEAIRKAAEAPPGEDGQDRAA
jgi:transposase-like protein